ncbi:hypothetical protein GNP79_12185 [Aliivibrio fischeri]|uniref:Uncharacterized protein n=1 Tax=Aliivibrio fischeri TaxID=668 RepID=A0A6N3Z4Y4_ALIFS|nr:hypothetical protein [Aliivibrio fischeri]MUK45700.1 hypothetical protein [Aliivibrio fischeri]MUK81549.1 hypothetical protein [Aliivibrio fischeri]MUK86595.1 hypothetical protein [Aliivibrio fischeri]
MSLMTTDINSTLINIASIIAMLASMLAGFTTAIASKKVRIKGSRHKAGNEIDYEFDTRLVDVKVELDRQCSILRWQSLAATSLTFSQYIIGGVLTTSFIQDTLSSNIVGLLGLLVLISSLIHQHFRPDLKARLAKEQIVKLRSLLRDVEDNIFAIRNDAQCELFIKDIRSHVSSALNEIENTELQQFSKKDAEQCA